jgi:predicted DCC family thiol-disulfide oxidoreductase YuxK
MPIEKVLFNEKCSLCNFEIKHYKKRSNLNFVDCSEMKDKYLKRLHVILPGNVELSGVDAFIYVWRKTNGYEWLATLINLPGVKHIAVFLYAIISRLLFWKFKLLNKNNQRD